MWGSSLSPVYGLLCAGAHLLTLLATCRFEQMLGDVMLEVKKLRTLQRQGGNMDKNRVKEKTRKYLVRWHDAF